MPSETNQPKRRRPRWLSWTLEVAVLLAIFFAIRAYTQRGTIEGPAPSLEGRGLDGAALSLGALRGEPVLVHFWASWCSVCKLQQGAIDDLAREHRVITVAVESGDARKVADFMRREGLGFPVIVDEEGRLGAAFGVKSLPSDFVIDREGNIRFVEVGYSTGLGLRARLWLAGR